MQSFDVWEFQKKGAEVEVFGKQKSRVNKVYVGRDGTNRVISGLLLTQTRKKLEVCSEHSEVSGLTAALFGGSPHARFKDLANRCPSESQVMKDPYGFDAQFLSASKLYNKFVVSEKNDIFPDSTKLSPSGIPYGFHYIDMSAKKGVQSPFIACTRNVLRPPIFRNTECDPFLSLLAGPLRSSH